MFKKVYVCSMYVVSLLHLNIIYGNKVPLNMKNIVV